MVCFLNHIVITSTGLDEEPSTIPCKILKYQALSYCAVDYIGITRITLLSTDKSLEKKFIVYPCPFWNTAWGVPAWSEIGTSIVRTKNYTILGSRLDIFYLEYALHGVLTKYVVMYLQFGYFLIYNLDIVKHVRGRVSFLRSWPSLFSKPLVDHPTTR